MPVLRTASVGFAAAAVIGACVFASPARADWDDSDHHWHHGDGGYRSWGPPAVVVAPQPYYYAPPAAYYVPPPVTYAPPPETPTPLPMGDGPDALPQSTFVASTNPSPALKPKADLATLP